MRISTQLQHRFQKSTKDFEELGTIEPFLEVGDFGGCMSRNGKLASWSLKIPKPKSLGTFCLTCRYMSSPVPTANRQEYPSQPPGGGEIDRFRHCQGVELNRREPVISNYKFWFHGNPQLSFLGVITHPKELEEDFFPSQKLMCADFFSTGWRLPT